MAVPSTPVRIPSQMPLAPSDNEMIPGAVHRSSGIYRTAEENFNQKTVDKGCVTSHRLKWGPLPLNEVGRIAQHARKRKRRKEGNDWRSILSRQVDLLPEVVWQALRLMDYCARQVLSKEEKY